MSELETKTLFSECITLLDYYLDKTESIMKLYQDTAEIQYFLFALKGTKSFLTSKENIDIDYLNKCINSLISGQKGRTGNDRLTNLRIELEEELELLKLRFDLK
ncbi:MAG: hypothetical protein QNJ57_06835 [Flavobacteriaceae bacterium]|nr:hypothetical protein [Flavobacteriaceae bacterium]